MLKKINSIVDAEDSTNRYSYWMMEDMMRTVSFFSSHQSKVKRYHT